MEWLLLSEKCIWFGLAAVGFGILFNIPSRTLVPVFIMGAIGGFAKVALLHLGINIVGASLFGATLIGCLSIPFAHSKHAPPPMFSIPAVIPMVPGVLAYRMMLGLINLAADTNPAAYNQILSETIHNGLKVMFILMSLAIGVALPMLVTRKESAKEIRFRRPIK